jgi:hypothetical protein
MDEQEGEINDSIAEASLEKKLVAMHTKANLT